MVAAEALQVLSWLAYTGPSCGERQQCCMAYARSTPHVRRGITGTSSPASDGLSAITFACCAHMVAIPVALGCIKLTSACCLLGCRMDCSTGLPQPAQHVAESWNAAEFFANKLLREFRGVDEAQVAWVQALKVRSSSGSVKILQVAWLQALKAGGSSSSSVIVSVRIKQADPAQCTTLWVGQLDAGRKQQVAAEGVWHLHLQQVYCCGIQAAPAHIFGLLSKHTWPVHLLRCWSGDSKKHGCMITAC